jgi:hypothetical protein
MCIIDQSQQITPAQNVSAMKMPESHSKEVLAIRCPECGSPAGAPCELSTGQARSTPHRDRLPKAKVEKPLASD